MTAMRFKILLPIFIFIAIVLSSCKKDEKGSGVIYPLHLHLEAGFDNDSVKLYIDGNRVFNDVVTTSPLIGLAEAIIIQQPEGVFEMTIEVNNREMAVEDILIDEELYVLMNFYNDLPTIDTSTTAPGYD